MLESEKRVESLDLIERFPLVVFPQRPATPDGATLAEVGRG